MVEELSEDDDPFSLSFLIEQAGNAADYLEQLGLLLNGDRQSWLSLKMGPKVVEVQVAGSLAEHRRQTETLGRLLARIADMRAALPKDDPDDDLAGL